MRGLPWDMSRCSANRCPHPGECLRSTRHPSNLSFPEHRPMSVCNFADHNGDCARFIPDRPCRRCGTQLNNDAADGDHFCGRCVEEMAD